jgi:hypothetical protein
MIISIDAKKSLWQNSTSLHDKSSEETKNKRNIHQHNKDYEWQIYSQHHTESGKTEMISSKVRDETGYLLSSFLFNTGLDFLAKVIS